MRETPQEIVENLKVMCRNYDDIKKTIVSFKQRLKALVPEAEAKNQDVIGKMDSIKNTLSRRIGKELEYWPIWTDWMANIDGIGPFIAGNLILLYYYRFIPVCEKCGVDLVDFECPKCGEKAKGKGLLSCRLDRSKDFECVSAWWSYMGEANDPETGRMVRRKRGEKVRFSTRGRQISWTIGENINRNPAGSGQLYKDFYLKHKENGKRHGDAIRRARKLFLSHFWHVARDLEGKSTEGPYVEVILGHTGIIKPYYYKPACKVIDIRDAA